jgi:hypothetical protein
VEVLRKASSRAPLEAVYFQGGSLGEETELETGEERLVRQVVEGFARDCSSESPAPASHPGTQSALQEARLRPDVLLAALVTLTARHASRVRSSARGYDPAAEARSLGLEYAGPGRYAEGGASPAAPLKTAHELISERRRAHIARHVEAQRLVREAEDLRHRLHRVSERFDGKDVAARATAREDEDEDVLEHARILQRLEVELAGELAALEAAQAVEARLVAERDQRRAVQAEAEAKLSQIASFEDRCVAKQQDIQRLIVENMHLRRAIEAHAHAFAASPDRLGGHQGGALDQARAIAALDGEETMLVAAATLGAAAPSGPPAAAVADLARRLKVPVPLAAHAENLLQHCSDRVLAMRQLEALVARAREAAERTRLSPEAMRAEDPVRVAELVEALAAKAGAQVHQTVPQLEAALEEVNRAFGRVSQVKQISQDWWAQPAQHTVPWVTVDGKNMAQFTALWRALCAELRA